MGFRLPDPGLQGFANRTVSLQRYGDQIKSGYAHRRAWGGTKRSVLSALKSQVYLQVRLSISALHGLAIKGNCSEGKAILCMYIYIEKWFIPSFVPNRIEGSK